LPSITELVNIQSSGKTGGCHSDTFWAQAEATFSTGFLSEEDLAGESSFLSFFCLVTYFFGSVFSPFLPDFWDDEFLSFFSYL